MTQLTSENSSQGGLSLLHSSIAANTLQDSGQGIVNRVKVFAIYIFDV